MRSTETRMCNPGREPEEAGCGVLPAGGVQVRIARIESGSMRSVDRSRTMNKPPTKQIWRAGNMLYPLPAVMVSCARNGEKPNIITVAWAGTVCTNPPMVSVSIRPERHSYGMIEESGEFVINLVTQELVRACDWCGVRSGLDHDKFAFCGLDALPAEGMTYAPLIAQSPVNIACRVVQKIPLGSHDLFLAKVVSIHVDPDGLDEKGRYDLDRAGLVAYSHGEYFALGRKLGSFGYSVKKEKPSGREMEKEKASRRETENDRNPGRYRKEEKRSGRDKGNRRRRKKGNPGSRKPAGGDPEKRKEKG